MPAPSDDWREATDHGRIRDWAERNDVVPARIEDRDGDAHLDVVPEPEPEGGERITWDRFFEIFEVERLALRYRSDEASARPDCELVPRSGTDAGDAPTDSGREQGDSEQFATSDTGDAEPVVTDRVESEETESQPGDDLERGPDESGPGRARADDPRAGDPIDETDHPLVLDELYEDPGGLTDSGPGEYVVFANGGDERLDLSGWRVENQAGRSYEFPEGTVLGPGERIVLHGDAGDAGENDLHWGSADPVWDETGGTVVVRTPDGRRVLREPYKG